MKKFLVFFIIYVRTCCEKSTKEKSVSQNRVQSEQPAEPKRKIPKELTNCSARAIPYIYDEKSGRIDLIMVTVKRFGDWTAFGGHCDEIRGNCPDKNDAELLKCLKKEITLLLIKEIWKSNPMMMMVV